MLINHFIISELFHLFSQISPLLTDFSSFSQFLTQFSHFLPYSFSLRSTLLLLQLHWLLHCNRSSQMAVKSIASVPVEWWLLAGCVLILTSQAVSLQPKRLQKVLYMYVLTLWTLASLHVGCTAYLERSTITYQYQYRFFVSVNSGNYYITYLPYILLTNRYHVFLRFCLKIQLFDYITPLHCP